MIIGYSGSRLGMPPPQAEMLMQELHRLGATSLHHGDCKGGDAGAHEIARKLGLHVVGHPPTSNGLRAFCVCDELQAAAPFLTRNRNIVHETQLLIACPDGPERLRSGTWTTIRFARKLVRPIIIITPVGRTIVENIAA